MEPEQVVVDDFGAKAALVKAGILLDAELAELKRHTLERDLQLEIKDREIKLLKGRIERKIEAAKTTRERVEHVMKNSDKSLILMIWSWIITMSVIAVYMLGF